MLWEQTGSRVLICICWTLQVWAQPSTPSIAVTAYTSAPVLSGSHGDLHVCSCPLQSQFLQLLANPTLLYQPFPSQAQAFSLHLWAWCQDNFGTLFWGLWSLTTHVSVHLWGVFGTTLRHPSCIAIWTTSPLPHSLQDCCIPTAVLDITHFRIQTAFYKILQLCSLPAPM